MTTYISGPITNIPNGNKEAFEAAEKYLLSLGYLPVNPHDLPHNHDRSWESYMREDLKAMLDCEAILILPGWESSRGATIEANLARTLGLHFVEYNR